MDFRNYSEEYNMTDSLSTSLPSARLELIIGVVCFVAGFILLIISLVVFVYTFRKKRKMRKNETQKENMKGQRNPVFEMNEFDSHIGLPLPSRSSIFSLSNYNVTHQHSTQQQQQQQANKRQDSSSSSDSEAGVINLHRTSPLNAIYLIYDELNKNHTQLNS